MPFYEKYQNKAWIAIVLGLAIIFHQIINWGRIDISDILHHEWFSGILIAFGLGILIVLPRKYRGPPK